MDPFFGSSQGSGKGQDSFCVICYQLGYEAQGLGFEKLSYDPRDAYIIMPGSFLNWGILEVLDAVRIGLIQINSCKLAESWQESK